MSCRHEHGFVLRTGMLLHAFCGECFGWLSFRHDSIALTTAPRRSSIPDWPLEVDGVTRTYREWGELLDATAINIYNRLHRGWSAKRAVTQPVHRQARNR